MKTKALSSKWLILLAVALVLVATVFAFTLNTDAAETQPAGMTFTKNDFYQVSQHVNPNGPITFETEIYIPTAQRGKRAALISNYNNGISGHTWSFELTTSNTIRLYHSKHATSFYFSTVITDFMGTDDSNPKFVKIAITVDTKSASNNAKLYINGALKETKSISSVNANMYNTENAENKVMNSLISIGGDRRLGNNPTTPFNFTGYMKNIALYKGVRAISTQNHFDTNDSNMIFGYDLTNVKNGFLEDLSGNGIYAINRKGEGKSFTAGELYTMSKGVPQASGSKITFECELYIPEAYRTGSKTGQRVGVLVSNYIGTADQAWAFEIMDGGKVRVFSNLTNGGDITIDYDIRQHMGGTDADPEYADIAVTVDTSTGAIQLYVDGTCRKTFTNDKANRADVYTVNRELCIGGDKRSGNSQYFKGKIRSVAMFSGIRTTDQIRKDQCAAFCDTSDPSLIFAHNLMEAHDGFIEDKSANKNHANSNKWTATEGRAFSSADEPMYPAKNYTEAPLSYEALIYAPVNSSRPGVLWGNYPNNTGSCLNFEIYTGGKPSLYIYENGALRTNGKFNYDVRRNAWVHLVITQETVNNKDTLFKCYVDGELVDTYTQADYVYELDMNEIQLTGPISIGRDVRASEVYEGRIKNVAIHNKTLTAEEVMNSYKNDATVNAGSFIAYYDLAGSNATPTSIKDMSGNGYDMRNLFFEKNFETEDYDYSFAVVGDTQFMVYNDAINGTDYTKYIYNWIVDNYSAKKMQYVFGLGDIIDNVNGSASAEYNYAKNLIVSTLGANNIPYSLIAGNHEWMRPSDAGFNKTFANETTMTKNITGYYEAGKVYNYYMNFEVEGTPYMLLALEYGANDDILAWANDIVAANKHRRVIVTTHGYMYRDGTTLDEGDWDAPRPNGAEAWQMNYNNGDEMWDQFVRKHGNIIMVLSGHDPCDNIIMREDIGDNGNTVQQFLIDQQGMDKTYSYQTGMVAMLYFRNGGKDVSVEYVSTYKTAKNNNKEVLFGRSQFDFEIKEATNKEAPKGEINVWLIGGQSNAVGYANGLSEEQINDARYTNGFNNILYYGYGEKWQTSFAPVKLGYGNTASASGAELGIASALGNTGEMNAIIKYAQGATALYPVTDSWAATNFGTWTSPSYIKNKNIETSGNLVGNLYVNFIDTVASAITELRRMGYTPVIKGMWWMQGEEETYNGGADSYKDLLTYLVSDIRTDLTGIVGSDMSKMPFVIGKVFTEKRPDLQEGIKKVQEMQQAYVNSDPYSAIVNPDFCSDYALQDEWHFDAATQNYLGKTFIEKANLINGDYIVEIVGNNVGATGGGLYKKGENVNITFSLANTYELNTLNVKVGSAAATSIINKLNNMSYSFVCEDNTTFTAVATSDAFVNTDYGDIPMDDASAPVVLFASGVYVGAYQNVTEAANKAMENPAGHYVILLRDNVSQTNGLFISNLTGSITLDLGGYTLTKAGSAYIFECLYNGAGFDGGKLTVKNGYLVNKEWSAFFCYNYQGNLSGNVTFDFEFDNVSFKTETTQAGKNVIFETWDNGGNTAGAINANVVFNDCIFDYTGSASGEIMLGLTCGSSIRSIFNVTINGGEIIADRTIGIAELATMDNGDSVKFGKGANGYTVCEITNESEISTAQLDAVNGAKLSYSFGVTSENGILYTLGEDVVTDYGTIPYKYTDASAYPFIVFRNGSFVHASYYFGRDNAESALSNGKTNGTVILMRRDFTYNESQYNNLSQTYTITIDLGGYTFTSTDRIVFSAQKKTENDTSITIKNGTFVLGSNPFMRFSSWDPDNTADGGKEDWGNYEGGNGFNFIFENVNITLTSGATTTTVVNNNGFKAINPDQFCNLTFNNCTFDLKGSANATVTLFDFSDAHCTAKAVINGGQILTNGIKLVNLSGANAASSLSFAKLNGNYTTISIKSGVAAPSESYIVENGVECIFAKVSENGGYVNYSLYPKVMVGYKLQTSVTLYSNFVYNIYIPKANVKSFTINGNTAEYTTVTIEGVEYYCVSVELPAPETLNDIKVKVTLNSGSTTVDANWTLNVLKYAKSVLADTDTDDLTKASQTLVKDMLVYAKAAHTYFGDTASVADKLTEITTILGTYSATLPTGTAKKPTDKTYFTDVAVYVGEVPSFRFYLAEGYSAADFTFTVGGNAVQVKEENGYVEIAMYAYRMLDDVTFTVNTTGVSESYNLYSYYEFAKTQNNANLVSIVEGLMKYSASAKAYRAAYIAANPNT